MQFMFDRAGVVRLAMGLGIVGIGAMSGGEAFAQARYNPGDRVECNLVGSPKPDYEKYYEPGTVLAFRDGDGPDGS